MATGTVKRYDTNRGFGFITCEDGTEVFVHHSAVKNSTAPLREGQVVDFDMGEGPKGKRAENVVLRP